MDKFCSFLANFLNLYYETNISLENSVTELKYVNFLAILTWVKNGQILFIFNQLLKFYCETNFSLENTVADLK